MAVLFDVTLLCKRSGQGPGTRQHFIKRRAKLQGQVYGHQDRSWKILRKPLRQEEQGLKPAG